MTEENRGQLRAWLRHARSAEHVYEPALQVLRGPLLLPGTGQWPQGDPALAARYGDLLPDLPVAQAIFDGGVYDADGSVVEAAIHLGGGRRHLPAPAPDPAPVTELPGRWLWGGVLHGHFGHFLTESLGRLWAWPRQDPPPTGVLWLLPGPTSPRRRRFHQEILGRPYIAGILDRLRVPGEHRIVAAPLRPAELLVPSQLMMNANRLVGGHPAYRDFVRQLQVAPPPGAARRLYVSRAGLAGGGRFVAEDAIEAAFAFAGWGVLRPETLGLEEQLAAYAGARELVFAEGSALHLFALVARPEQKVAVLCRRLPGKRKFEFQLRAHGVRRAVTIDAIAGLLLPQRRGRDGTPRPVPVKDADALLDTVALEAALVAHGFVPPGAWQPPSPAWFAAAAEAACAARSADRPEEPHAVVDRATLLAPHAADLAAR